MSNEKPFREFLSEVKDAVLEAFDHQARWNAEDSRIEMHLVSRSTQTVGVDGRSFGRRHAIGVARGQRHAGL